MREPERLCVCLDTAHVFAAGYDLAASYQRRKALAEFDRVIVGLDRLAALHLNDSKTARGSRVDRHEHIGKGRIGLAAFRFIMRDRRFRKIPKVLKTPKDKSCAKTSKICKRCGRSCEPRPARARTAHRAVAN